MVVADGMGGHYYGEIAAQIAVQTLMEAFQRQAYPKIQEPFSFLTRSMRNAQSAILDYAHSRKLTDSPRTTCVACLIQDNVAYWAHSGDSRLYLIRRGKVLARTRDHTRVRLLVEQGVINEAQAATHQDRNKVYSCLGGAQEPGIELSRKTPLDAGDVIVLCTDGLWGAYPDDLLASELRHGNLTEIVPKLLDRAEEQNGSNGDNLSVIAVRWEDNYVEPGEVSSVVYTQTMPLGAVTTQFDQFGHNPDHKMELTEEEIERAIEDIRATIQKFSK